jgi:hypothetical protein
MDRLELAWAAGFWDGEGSAWLTRAEGRLKWQPQARINQADQGGMPDVLIRFHRAVGHRGTLHGPERSPGKRDLYRWSASSRPEIIDVARLIGPWLGHVKLAQFALTLDIPQQDLRRDAPDAFERRDEQLAWAAGFWDGEGSTYLLRHRSHPGYFIVEACLTQSSEAGRSAPLDRFGSIVALGVIRGPIKDKRDVTPYYRWKDTKASAIRATMRALWPWLGPIKKGQAEAALRIVEMQRQLPRGNPVWGNRKTHCVNGHDYGAARIRPFRGRGKNTEAPRASHQCLACVRDHARRKRLERKRRAAAGQPPLP